VKSYGLTMSSKPRGKGSSDYAHRLAYESTPEQIHKRSLRNQARRKAIKAGIIKPGDSRDVGHKKALDKGGSNSVSNIHAESVAHNRGYARDKHNNPKH
jgi:hypothetical protein